MSRGLLAELTGDLKGALAGRDDSGVEATLLDIRRRLVDRAARRPIDTMVDVTLGGTVLYYLLERAHNPRVTTLADAFWAVTSCIAAAPGAAGGAVTSRGKVLLGLVMGVGPGLQSLVAAEGATCRTAPPPADALAAATLERLDRIAELLEQLVGQREA